MQWRLRATILRTLAMMPGGFGVYQFLQRRMGAFHQWSFIRERLEAQVTMAAAWQRYGGSCDGIRTVEIGTGWVPILPFGWWLCGAARCDTFDLNPYLEPSIFKGVLREIVNRRHEVARVYAAIQPPEKTLERLQNLPDSFGIEYHAPADAASTSLSDASIDVHYSNSVFEHLPPEVVPGLLAEGARVLKPSGLTMHLIDPSDHFAHFDAAISRVHFLQFDEQTWHSIAGNRFAYHNRLREPEWRALLRADEIETVELSSIVDAPSREALASMTLDPRFGRYTRDELASEKIFWVGRKVRSR